MLGLLVASLIRRVATGALGTVSRTVLFLPQVIPLVAAGIVWSWLLSKSGLVNQVLDAIGLGGITRAWLADFALALPAVGVIGAWVLLGLCTILLLTGMSKIDQALYESARIDGASAWQEFRRITVPSLRYEIGVCITVTVIASLAAFDIVYISTGGGPGATTAVPGSRDLSDRVLRPPGRRGVGARGPAHRPGAHHGAAHPAAHARGEGMIVGRTEVWTGRLLLIVLMVVTIVPFVSLFTTALHPSRTVPSGLSWPDDPQWGNFLQAFQDAHMDALLTSSVLIVLGVVPVSVVLATMAGFAIGHLRIRGSRALFILFLLGLTLPLAGIIIPLYYVVRSLGFYDTKLAIILPLIGLYMPFGVFWMRAHFLGMPPDLSEAARVDGASLRDLFWRIHVPLAKPAVASLAILLTVWTWNQFLLALVLVENPTERTMAGALGTFLGQYNNDIPLLMAGSLVILTPTLIVFLIFQRQFISALLQGVAEGVSATDRPAATRYPVALAAHLEVTLPQRTATADVSDSLGGDLVSLRACSTGPSTGRSTDPRTAAVPVLG